MFWISVFAAIGIAILLVEKGEDWPVSNFIPAIKAFLDGINKNLSGLLGCAICASFWSALITDSFLFIFTSGSYFLWPLSGFAAVGLAWLIYQLLDALEKSPTVEEQAHGEDWGQKE